MFVLHLKSEYHGIYGLESVIEVTEYEYIVPFYNTLMCECVSAGCPCKCESVCVCLQVCMRICQCACECAYMVLCGYV